MDDIVSTNAVFVIGNGFDLHLKLESKMKDFFENRVLEKGNDVFIYKGTNLIYCLLYYRFFASGSYDYYYFRRIDNNDPTWMDVEGFISKIATSESILSLLKQAYRAVLNKTDSFTFASSIIGPIKNIFNQRKISHSGAESFVNQMLLDDLIEFENDFKEYMMEQLKNTPNYETEKQVFMDKIINQIFRDDYLFLNTYVYNFNYTPLETAADYVSNVHGSLKSNIVIGFDSTTIKEYDKCVYELSKDWQKVAIDESEIDLKSLDSKDIIFYGHSLGEQDYPYFFEIFDQLKLLENNSDTTLYFAYSEFGDVEEQKVFKRNYQINIAKLLNSYENYRNSSITRNTIVTKLKAQNRLKVVKIVD